MNTTVAPTRDNHEALAAIIKEYMTMGKDEHFLLEPGDPFYEEYEAFDATNSDGPEVTSFLQYFAQDGAEISAGWETVKPKHLSDHDLRHFRNTPNQMLIGRDGTIIVSAGRWGRRKKPEGGYEYLPFDEYQRWRGEQLLISERTIENRPAWAERIFPWTIHNSVDYMLERGDITYKQKLDPDGLRDPGGHVTASFKTADDLRTLAREALAFADLIDNPMGETK